MRWSSGGAAYSGSLYSCVHRLGDGRDGVQADQVGQLERPHRVGAAQLHAVVDVLAGRDAGLEHPDRGEQVGHQQRVDHEARAVLGADRVLAEHVGDQLLGAQQCLLAGGERRDQLDELLHRGRVEEVDAEHVVRAGGGDGELHQRDGGGVGGQDRVRPGQHLVEHLEDLGLDLLVLHDGLDHQVAVGELAEVRGEGEAVERRVALLLGDLAALGGLAQGVGQPGPAQLQRLAGGLGDPHVQPGPGTHLGDARAHLAAAHHSDVTDVARRPVLAHLVQPFPSDDPGSRGALRGRVRWTGPRATIHRPLRGASGFAGHGRWSVPYPAVTHWHTRMDAMPYDADVIVVGAGLAGLVATAELADAGRKVILLDQEPRGVARRAGVLVLRRTVPRRLARAAPDAGHATARELALAGLARHRRLRPRRGPLAAPLGRGVRRLRRRREALLAARPGACGSSRSSAGPSAAATTPPGTATPCPASTSPGAPDPASAGAVRPPGPRGGRPAAWSTCASGTGSPDWTAAADRSTASTARCCAPSGVAARRGQHPGGHRRVQPARPGGDRHLAAASAATTTWSAPTGRSGWALRRSGCSPASRPTWTA